MSNNRRHKKAPSKGHRRIYFIRELVRVGAYDYTEKVRQLIEDGFFGEDDIERCIETGRVCKTQKDEMRNSVGCKKYTILGSDCSGTPFYCAGKIMRGRGWKALSRNHRARPERKLTMFGYPCTKCGKGVVKGTTVRGYETRIDGMPFTVPRAHIGVCSKCGARYFNVRESRKWRDGFYKERAEKRSIVAASQISELRECMGMTVADLARLIGCSRQALHYWESVHRRIPQSRMANLMLRLVRVSFEKGSVNVIEFLIDAAKADGIHIEKPVQCSVKEAQILSVDSVDSAEVESGPADQFDSLYPRFSQPQQFSPRLRLVA